MPLCIIEKHQDSWASLVASNWASGLICIIRFSQLWNSFDLPPSLVTEWDRVPPLLLFSSCFIHHTHFFSVLHVHHPSPDTQIYPSLTLWSYYAALHLSISIPPLPSISFHHTSSCTLLILWWYIEEAPTVLVLNSPFGFHLSNQLKNWINFFSSDTKGI